jgi:hypothetical protein
VLLQGQGLAQVQCRLVVILAGAIMSRIPSYLRSQALVRVRYLGCQLMLIDMKGFVNVAFV